MHVCNYADGIYIIGGKQNKQKKTFGNVFGLWFGFYQGRNMSKGTAEVKLFQGFLAEINTT